MITLNSIPYNQLIVLPKVCNATMNIRPQDENGIVALILRDINTRLRETPNFDFNLAATTKTTKVIFTIAEKLDIPITRSWYRHGGYIHNQLIKNNPITGNEQIKGVTQAEIEEAEKYLAPYQKTYDDLLSAIVPKYFFMSLPTLLTIIYQSAPEPYRTMYSTNLDLFKAFRNVTNPSETAQNVFQQVITNYGIEQGRDFGYYRAFSPILSKMAIEMTEVGNFSRIQPNLSSFSDLFEDYLVKASYEGAIRPVVFHTFQKTYEEAVWFPSAHIISLNTATGTMQKQVKSQQLTWLTDELPKIQNNIQFLRSMVIQSNLKLTLEERRNFFNTIYGKDTEVIGAIADVWKAYKG